MKVKEKAQPTKYKVELSQDEAEVIFALVSRTNSVYERHTDGIYDALEKAGLKVKYEVNSGFNNNVVITLRPR
jgi:hypothetical protein